MKICQVAFLCFVKDNISHVAKSFVLVVLKTVALHLHIMLGPANNPSKQTSYTLFLFMAHL